LWRPWATAQFAPALKSGLAAAMSVNCCPAVGDHSRFAVYGCKLIAISGDVVDIDQNREIDARVCACRPCHIIDLLVI